jgi:hypothetical protein
LIALVCCIPWSSPAASWRDASHRGTLKNDAIEAHFQAGYVSSLIDRSTGNSLVSIDPADLPSQMLVFDESPTDLDSASVHTQASQDSILTVYRFPDGRDLRIGWSIEEGAGDLVLRVTSRTTGPVEQFRYTFFGCDIEDHALVWIRGNGTAVVMQAPWEGIQLGDPQRHGSPASFCHPVVALFQGERSGWFMEGRDSRIGPAYVLLKGAGNAANVGMVRRFPIGVQSPELFEARIRTYRDHWEDAADPYVEWLERGAGFLPIVKLPPPQAWVKDIRAQSYITVGDYDTLEKLAARVDPAKIFIGRQTEHRYHAMGIAYPDYRLTEEAKKWTRRVRELGFHVGVHFNSNAIGTEFPELVERFRPGFAVTGKDADGNDTYQSLYQGRLIRCSPAYKPWRDYLIEQMQDAVEAGVDVIYLDESMACTGKYIVDGVSGIEGMTALIRETLEAYPHVAVQTEQFSPLTAKYGKLALSQMPLGHPLSAYIFRRYVKVVPEGVMYSPTSTELLDAFDYWGGMLPGANPGREESWLQIAAAFQRFDLVPDGRLPRKPITDFSSHYTGGTVPMDDAPVPSGGVKLFGYRGGNGVTAYLEKYPTRRGLVVYEPDKPPQWFGTRHYAIRRWKGPGVPSYYGYRQYMKDWICYDEDSLIGLDPAVTYRFDESVERSPARFHVTRVPDDFAGYDDMERRIAPYEVGRDDSFFRLVFAGHGEMSMYVPDAYDVFLDGERVDVDRSTRTATVTVSAELPKSGSLGYFIALQPDGAPAEEAGAGRPSTLLAFRRTDGELAGPWVGLPWQRAKDSAKKASPNGDDFSLNVGAFAVFIGRFPPAKRLRLQGSYTVGSTTGQPGDGVVLLNGKQVLRIPTGNSPYPVTKFNTDISSYAEKYVLMEILSDNSVRAATAAWIRPRIVVEL